jgi:hypothetical protein
VSGLRDLRHWLPVFSNATRTNFYEASGRSATLVLVPALMPVVLTNTIASGPSHPVLSLGPLCLHTSSCFPNPFENAELIGTSSLSRFSLFAIFLHGNKFGGLSDPPSFLGSGMSKLRSILNFCLFSTYTASRDRFSWFCDSFLFSFFLFFTILVIRPSTCLIISIVLCVLMSRRLPHIVQQFDMGHGDADATICVYVRMCCRREIRKMK